MTTPRWRPRPSNPGDVMNPAVNATGRRTARPPKGIGTGWSSTVRRFVHAVALAPVVVVAGALSACTPSSGGTASVTAQPLFSTLHFDAVNGRSNSITVALGTSSSGYPTSLLLTDSRNPVTPGSGCTRVDDNTVRCSHDPSRSVGFLDQIIKLGDGDDSFVTTVALARDTVVHAGPGDDTLNGGPSRDIFFEDSDGLDRDVFAGGAGSDFVRYAGVLHAVSISLNDVADDGRPGEGDNVKIDVEGIGGTGNADTLTGDGDRNWIEALDPTDATVDVQQLTGGAVIDGKGGDDSITGTNWGNANDRLSGASGNDDIDGYAGNDVIDGGTGDDDLRGREGFDTLDGGSETDFCDVGPGGGTTVNCETGP